jgi:hypothetical protein
MSCPESTFTFLVKDPPGEIVRISAEAFDGNVVISTASTITPTNHLAAFIHEPGEEWVS